MVFNLSRIVIPGLVGGSVYVVVQKLFPGKVQGFEKYQSGDKINSAKNLRKRILANRALKIALCATVTTAGVQYFQPKIAAFLIDNVFQYLCVRKINGDVTVLCDCDQIQEYTFDWHTKLIKSFIVSDDLTPEQKISFLKIELDFMINNECKGEKFVLILGLIAGILTLTISGVGGLALILEALSRLFKEGKIEKTFYRLILQALARKFGAKNVPIEDLLD